MSTFQGVSKRFKVPGIASNILRNKSFKLFASEIVVFYTKQDFLFHIDTTLMVAVLLNRKSLDFYYLKSRQFAVTSIHPKSFSQMNLASSARNQRRSLRDRNKSAAKPGGFAAMMMQMVHRPNTTPVGQDRKTLTFKLCQLYLNVDVYAQVCRLFFLVHIPLFDLPHAMMVSKKGRPK